MVFFYWKLPLKLYKTTFCVTFFTHRTRRIYHEVRRSPSNCQYFSPFDLFCQRSNEKENRELPSFRYAVGMLRVQSCEKRTGVTCNCLSFPRRIIMPRRQRYCNYRVPRLYNSLRNIADTNMANCVLEKKIPSGFRARALFYFDITWLAHLELFIFY